MMANRKSNLFAALQKPEGDQIIPYINKWLVMSPHAGLFQVDDRPYQTRNPDRATKSFHPSGDCMKCERLLYFERDVNTELQEEPIDARLQSIFKMGSSVHAMIQAWFAAMSELPGFPQLVENEMRIEGGCFDGYGVGGYIDSVVRFPNCEYDVPIELKSIGSGPFSRLSGPKPEHRLQVGCYIAYLEAPFGIVLYMNKDTCEFKEYKVEPVDLTNVLMRWSKVRRAIADGSPDGLSYGCKLGDDTDRMYVNCPARGICSRRLIAHG